MYDRVHQEQIVAGMTVQHRDENPGCARTSDRPRNSSSSYCGADTRKKVDITGLVNPQFSFTGVEVSTPQAVGSPPPFEEFDAPVYSQIHQEQIVAGETYQNTLENPVVQEQVVVQEIPQAPQVVDSSPLLGDVAARECNQVLRARAEGRSKNCGEIKTYSYEPVFNCSGKFLIREKSDCIQRSGDTHSDGET